MARTPKNAPRTSSKKGARKAATTATAPRAKPATPRANANSSRTKSAKKPKPAAPSPGREGQPPKLLSGGNPQIAKGDGDKFVQAYIAAMPGWKRDVGQRLDALVMRAVPNVRKAVRWNSPFWGVEDQGWFLAAHCISRYVKVTFFKGSQLEPPPPVESKMKDVRYFHIYEGDWSAGGTLDEAQLARWIKQAAELPGETCF